MRYMRFWADKKECTKWDILLPDDRIESEGLGLGLGLCLFRVKLVLVKLLHHLVEQGGQREKNHAAQKIGHGYEYANS